MPERTHGFEIDEARCQGRLACMRSCPTQAIRVRDGKARVIPELCIDCGSCLRVCPSGAIQAVTRPFAEIDKYRYKVAVPSPVLFGQFPVTVTPAHIVAALKSLGFDAVRDLTVELALVNRAVQDYVASWEGPFPLISVSCPVVVRLVQVHYPSMVGQLVRIQPARELAGREVKRRYSEALGISRDQIAAIYITPCQAKTISILRPAEDARSNLDGALGIVDVYNALLALSRSAEEKKVRAACESPARFAEMLRWSINESESYTFRRHHYLSVTGLPDVIQVFDDIEKGKLRNVEYLQCHACWEGCVSGNLTVDNSYVTLSKIARLLSELPEGDPEVDVEVERRYAHEDFSMQGELRPREVERPTIDLRERVKRVRLEEAVLQTLPGLDCGLCGTPNCRTFAGDVARGRAHSNECVFLSNQRIDQLRHRYLKNRKRPPKVGS